MVCFKNAFWIIIIKVSFWPGTGLSAYSNVVIVVENTFKQGFKMSNKVFHLLASGPNRVDIATLKFKVFIYFFET